MINPYPVPRIPYPAFGPFALLALAVFAAYGNVYDGPFFLDDEFLIVKNTFLRTWAGLPALLTHCSTAGSGGADAFYRPLQGLLYFIVYRIGGLEPFGFHLLNVGLHAANACLVFLLGQRLGFGKIAVFAAALLWAVHPVHTEAVSYISATADPLYAFFIFLGLTRLLPDFSPRRMIWGCVFFALALLAKETAIVFPVLAMLCLFVARDDGWKPGLYLKTLPLWLVAGAYLVLRFSFLHLDDINFYKEANPYSENIAARAFTFLATLPAYARVFLWPIDLHMERNFPVFISFWHAPVLLGAGMLLGSGAIVFRAWMSRGAWGMALSWGLLWFAAAHVLHTGLFLAVNGLFFEHWLYLPTAGLMLGIAGSLARRRTLPHARAALLAFAVLGALILGVLTWRQNRIWTNPVVFYESILSYGEPSVIAHNNLAMAYHDRGDLPRTVEHYRAAIALATRFAQPHHNLARALLDMPDAENRVPEAIAELEKAIEISPEFFQSYNLLADIYQQRGEREKAEAYRRKAIEILDKRLGRGD